MAVAAEWQDRIRRLFTVSLSDLNPFRGQESYVAIDIGSNSIKMLEVRTQTDHIELLNWGTIPTPASAIQSNMVSEPDRVAEGVKALLDSKGPRTPAAEGSPDTQRTRKSKPSERIPQPHATAKRGRETSPPRTQRP